MADPRGEADSAADRLEAALDRIARLAARPAAPTATVPEVAGRLDALIAQLREALDRPSP